MPTMSPCSSTGRGRSCVVAIQVQLISLGTHGRRGVTRFLMGSVAERVLHEAPCAVLVVPAPLQ